MAFFQYLLPQHFLSRLMFRFARIENSWVKNNFTRWFIKQYQVNLSEAEIENIEDFISFNDFEIAISFITGIFDIAFSSEGIINFSEKIAL